MRWSFDFSSSTLASRVFLALLEPRLPQLAAGLALGLPLRVLRRGDLLLDLEDRPAHDLAAQARHRGVDHLRALLGDVRQDRGPRRLDLVRDLAQDRVGRRDVVDVEQRSDERSVRAAEQHPDRAADDPDEQADDAAAGAADVAVVPDLALDVDATAGVARDDGGAGDLDLALRVELPELGERLVGVRCRAPGRRRR